MNRLLIFMFSFLGFMNALYTQDVHFSKKEAYEMQRNSALASLYEGDWQISTVYRKQWASVSVPFTTTFLHYNKKFYTTNRSLIFNSGINYIQDKTGDAELLVNKFFLDFGAHYRKLNHEFAGSLQFGYIRKQFSEGDLTLPSQFDREIGEFNSQLPSGESFQNTSLSYFSANLGMAWRMTINDRWKVGSGLSFRNLNQPKEPFVTENELAIATGIQLFGIYQISSNNSLEFYAYDFRFNKASETLNGVIWNHQLEGFDAIIDEFTLGISTRQSIGNNIDAFIPSLGVGIKGINISVAYDSNISDLELASGSRGGFELQLTYNGRFNALKQIALPCEHY